MCRFWDFCFLSANSVAFSSFARLDDNDRVKFNLCPNKMFRRQKNNGQYLLNDNMEQFFYAVCAMLWKAKLMGVGNSFFFFFDDSEEVYF